MMIYADSVILMYFFDYRGPFQVRASARFAAIRAAGDAIAVSDLTRLECRVRPMKLGDANGLAQYDQFFGQSNVQIVPLPTAVYDRATAIRSTYGFKTADAIHLAAAVESGCGTFLTNDNRLARFTGVPVELLP